MDPILDLSYPQSPTDFTFANYPPSPSNTSQSGCSEFSYSSPSSHAYSDPASPSLYCYTQQPLALSPQTRSRPQGSCPSARINIAHPYARLIAKKNQVKRRKIWNHALEKSLFSPFELSTIGAPQRRTIYIASLEAHIDEVHTRLIDLGYYPVAYSELEPFKGLNSKTAKSMVAGLQYDASQAKLKLLELQRANADLEKFLQGQVDHDVYPISWQSNSS